MHELRDFDLLTQDDDHISISSLSDGDMTYFINSKASWAAQINGNTRESHDGPVKPFQNLTDASFQGHNEAFHENSMSTELSIDDTSFTSGSSLSFKLVQDLEEADESIVYPVPESLTISSCKIGTVLQSVNDIVTVIGDGSHTVVDIGTFVGTANRVIGPVITLFGPVKSCYYAIRADTPFEAGEITSGDPIYLVEGTMMPIQEDLHLASMRSATDASYLNDKELPYNVMPDFSDDEAERNWKVQKRKF